MAEEAAQFEAEERARERDLFKRQLAKSASTLVAQVM
jgi:hypothetical protein